MSDSDFNVAYEKVRKRDHRDSLYRLRIRLLAYNCQIRQYNQVQLRDHGKNTDVINLDDNNYVVYDIISDSIFIAKKFYFERDYKIENTVYSNYIQNIEYNITYNKLYRIFYIML